METEDSPKLRAIRERRAAKEKAANKTTKPPQEQAPTIFPDLLWVWSVFCFLSDRRGVGPHGPVSITVEAMSHYLELTNRKHAPYVDQVLHYVPLLDREYLRDFYDKQAQEMEKARKDANKPANNRGLNRR